MRAAEWIGSQDSRKPEGAQLASPRRPFDNHYMIVREAIQAMLDGCDTPLLTIDTQNLQQVLLRVQVIGISLDELAHDRNRVQLQ